MSISNKISIKQTAKKGLLWLTLLCTVLLTRLNLPHSTIAAVIHNTVVKHAFMLSKDDAQITAFDENDVLDLGYKEESEGKKSKEEQENDQKREQEKTADTSIFLPTSFAPIFILLFEQCAYYNPEKDTTAICMTQAIPKYVLYQQYKYHLG